jgi:hypothetical protein
MRERVPHAVDVPPPRANSATLRMTTGLALGIVSATCLSVLGGCAGTQRTSTQEAMPNMYQRAKVVSKDDSTISIEHSESGKQIASRTAARHCATLKRVAVYRDTVTRLGSDLTSTWRCE